jgi:hypothetical protein
MRRTVFILIAVILLLALGLGWYFFFFERSAPASNELTGGQAGALPPAVGNMPASSSVPSALSDYIGQASQILGPLPTSTSLSIGTAQGVVQVANFYAADPPVIEGGEIVIKQTPNYVVVYEPVDSSFWLGITGTPFATWRAIAERDLLTTLDISEAEACKLAATSGIIYQDGDPLDGQSFPLSFCSAQVGK